MLCWQNSGAIKNDMILNIDNYPILNTIDQNRLLHDFIDMVEASDYDEEGLVDIRRSLSFFGGKTLEISCISEELYLTLNDTSRFIRDKSLLASTPETSGLLLLPSTIIPDFSNVPSYVNAHGHEAPIHAILYSWLESNNHDKVAGSYDEEDPWLKEGRTLLIIPICENRITQATDQFHLISNEEIYGWPYSESECRAWYGQVHDLIMSFILMGAHSEIYDQVILKAPVQRNVVIFNRNVVNMIS